MGIFTNLVVLLIGTLGGVVTCFILLLQLGAVKLNGKKIDKFFDTQHIRVNRIHKVFQKYSQYDKK